MRPLNKKLTPQEEQLCFSCSFKDGCHETRRNCLIQIRLRAYNDMIEKRLR